MDSKPDSSALNDLSIILSDTRSLLTKLENKLAPVSSNTKSEPSEATLAADQLNTPEHIHELINSANNIRERIEVSLNRLVI